MKTALIVFGLVGMLGFGGLSLAQADGDDGGSPDCPPTSECPCE